LIELHDGERCAAVILEILNGSQRHGELIEGIAANTDLILRATRDEVRKLEQASQQGLNQPLGSPLAQQLKRAILPTYEPKPRTQS
jgi:hypothetical protein